MESGEQSSSETQILVRTELNGVANEINVGTGWQIRKGTRTERGSENRERQRRTGIWLLMVEKERDDPYSKDMREGEQIGMERRDERRKSEGGQVREGFSDVHPNDGALINSLEFIIR